MACLTQGHLYSSCDSSFFDIVKLLVLLGAMRNRPRSASKRKPPVCLVKGMMQLEVFRVTHHDGIRANSDDRALSSAGQRLECAESGLGNATIFPVRRHVDKMLLALEGVVHEPTLSASSDQLRIAIPSSVP
jgi:hypothetical protein